MVENSRFSERERVLVHYPTFHPFSIIFKVTSRASKRGGSDSRSGDPISSLILRSFQSWVLSDPLSPPPFFPFKNREHARNWSNSFGGLIHERVAGVWLSSSPLFRRPFLSPPLFVFFCAVRVEIA
ncbi:uncharacterized protein LOC129286266 [Prosopis cineraria]|uniref:uncharacterized protein LOC129286266 n=1 Tax=Prosopis cineraria TaxID=364024 RepID=UPI00240F10C3|nr:uncharacterized protein LOC129286266 [Prosopis cineraria]